MTYKLAYQQQVVPFVERALALMDANPASGTYGCADRTFWQYRTLTNFPASSMQQLMLGLSVIYKFDHRDNPYHNDQRILDAACAMLSYWCKIQNRDGSFNEWYQNENSYCPTAFTTAGAALTIIELGDSIDPELRTTSLQALNLAAEWLDKRFNATVMNQNLVAALGLWALWRITDNPKWHRAAKDKYRQLESAQNDEGWFPEYGGFDFGYSTLSLDLLAAADSIGAGEYALPMANKLTKILMGLSSAGIGYPGRLGCRGTAHVFPYGAEYFSAQNPDAESLAFRWRQAYSDGALPGPGQVDDRYFAYFYFPQFALAYTKSPQETSIKKATLPTDPLSYPNAGISIERHGDWTLTTSQYLGGALAFQLDGLPSSYHLGYELVTMDGKRFSSAHWSPSNGPEGKDISFVKVSGGQPLVKLMVPFQIFTGLMIVGWLAELFQKTIKSVMIRPSKTLPCTLERCVTSSTHQLKIKDTICAGKGMPPLRALFPTQDISVHSPSARQDRASLVSSKNWNQETGAVTLNKRGQISIEYIVSFDPEGTTTLTTNVSE